MTDTNKKRKRAVVCLSSSSSSSSEEDDDSEFEGDELDDDGEISYCDEEEEDQTQLDGVSEDDNANGAAQTEESLSCRVISLLEEGNDLEALHLKECKAYIRQHGLRLAGTKAVCIQRIKEHWRLKDGNGEVFYPKSSFVINCTGDVCKGDVVLFTQKVYEKFNKLTRHGKLLGKRTVAGRVVKESYGSAKQQHTFTVEVLWSKGVRKLYPLFPLLVKGRNLYKLKTFRQRWDNETDRPKILAEKHKRGTAARHVRAVKKSKMFSGNGGAKPQKHCHQARSHQMRKRAEQEKNKYANGYQKDTSQRQTKFNNYHQKAPPSGQPNFKRNVSSDRFETSWRHRNLGHPSVDVGSATLSHPQCHQNSYASPMASRTRIFPHNFGCDTGSTPTMRGLHLFGPYANTPMIPSLQSQGLNFSTDTYPGSSFPSHNFGTRNWYLFPQPNNDGRPFHESPLRCRRVHRMQDFQGYHH